ncbi:MAG: Maf family protein [Pseudomonadota bacterium]|nr:Maf family protein [Pseudomonadota bacterium]
MKKKRIILGSSSIFRKNLLKTLNIDFESISPDIDESIIKGESAEEMVMRLAINKAKKISTATTNSLIISSDATAICKNTILGKPLTINKAREILNFISGNSVKFMTALCVMDSDSRKYKSSISEYVIQIQNLSNNNIEQYIKDTNPLYSTAAFKYEDGKDLLVKNIETVENDMSGLIGLPLEKVKSYIDIMSD